MFLNYADDEMKKFRERGDDGNGRAFVDVFERYTFYAKDPNL